MVDQPGDTPPLTTQLALNGDAARIGAELVRVDGGTDPFAAAVRATRMPMIVTDPRQPDNPVVFANNSFCRLTGYAREEILGRNCRFLQGPETDPEAVRRIRAAVDATEAIEIDIRNHRKSGEPFWNRLLLAPVRDAAGELAYFFASQVDVTLERERLAGLESRNAALLAELADRLRALQESEARFRHMADSAPALIWMTDAGGQVTFANMHFEFTFGLPSAGMLGQGWSRVVLPGDLGPFRRLFVAAFHDRRPFQAEVRVWDRDGQVRWMRAEGVPRLDDTGAFLGYTGCAVDITDTRLVAEELERRVAARTAELSQALDQLRVEAQERGRAEEALRQLQKMEALGQLTGGIAHDFNNMLQAIGGGLEMAQRRMQQGRAADMSRHVEAARQTVARAAALTHRLLAFARRQTLQPTLVEPDSLIGGLAELIRQTAGPAIAVEQRLRDGVWSVLCDPNQLENVLLNLAINARDAMPLGGRLTFSTRDVSLTPADVVGQDGAVPGDYVEIAVADTGTGMDEATRARAFEPFFTTKPIGQGTGLGLSQVYGFVRQSDGVVRLDSASGQGTTVRMYLPRHEMAQDRTEPSPPQLRPGQADAGRSVLLVEDEAEVRAVAAERLRELGYQVLEAADGVAALLLLRGSVRVDVLVTDVGLTGGLNGRQVADAARERRPGLPVLFITGYAGMVLDGQLAPGMAVIGKPFALDAMVAKVRSMVEGEPGP